ncbi:hypothetical protein ASG90_03985 [Nocardioides sp. Soil797]|nr:hypothetical protein ASG90_03985 [Nocardioides sp. Soil797]
MITVEQQTITTIVGVLGLILAFAVMMQSMKRDLKASIEQSGAALGARIDKTETTLGARIDKTETALAARIDKTETALAARIDKVEAKTEDTLTEMRNEHRSDMADIRAGLRALEQRFFEILLPQRTARTGTDDK